MNLTEAIRVALQSLWANVSPSTAAVSTQPVDLAAMKRLIREDRAAVQKARLAYKKAQKGKSEATRAKAREAWLLANEKLKADKKLEREAVVAHESVQHSSK